MKAAAFEYHRPASAEAAVEMLAELGEDAKVLAGGQSLVPVMAMRLGRPEHIVDVNRVAGLGACTVEVDPATGVVRILRYVVSEDRGNMINPMVVEGQIAGGVVQGIGGVFYEHMVYYAVRDALAPLGVRITTQPLTPEKIISLIEDGRPLR